MTIGVLVASGSNRDSGSGIRYTAEKASGSGAMGNGIACCARCIGCTGVGVRGAVVVRGGVRYDSGEKSEN